MQTSGTPLLAGRSIDQVGILVEDLDKAIALYWQTLGIGPWHVYTYGRPFVQDLTYRGQPGSYRMRLALASIGPLVVELIQPLEGPSIYAEFAAKRGHGLHHVGIIVPELRAAVREAAEAGFKVIQSGAGYGLDGDGGYAYLDSEDRVGIIVELIEVPKRRATPQCVYPA